MCTVHVAKCSGKGSLDGVVSFYATLMLCFCGLSTALRRGRKAKQRGGESRAAAIARLQALYKQVYLTRLRSVKLKDIA